MANRLVEFTPSASLGSRGRQGRQFACLIEELANVRSAVILASAERLNNVAIIDVVFAAFRGMREIVYVESRHSRDQRSASVGRFGGCMEVA